MTIWGVSQTHKYHSLWMSNVPAVKRTKEWPLLNDLQQNWRRNPIHLHYSWSFPSLLCLQSQPAPFAPSHCSYLNGLAAVAIAICGSDKGPGCSQFKLKVPCDRCLKQIVQHIMLEKETVQIISVYVCKLLISEYLNPADMCWKWALCDNECVNIVCDSKVVVFLKASCSFNNSVNKM